MTPYDPSGNRAPGRRSKYRRARHPVSWPSVLLGLILGIGGGLVWAWMIDPRVEFNTEPWQLQAQDRANYIVGVALSYSYDGDLNRAIERLLALRSKGDPIQEVADTACQLATTGYVDSSSGLRAIRAMMTFYQLQGRASCADTLIPAVDQPTPMIEIEVGTPTPPPPATKTPTPESVMRPTSTPQPAPPPTTVARSSYTIAVIRTYCDSELSGLIEVRVQDSGGDGIPGQPIRVRWDNGENTFYSGLKSERGPDYADFQMEAGKNYTVEMPGQSDPTQTLEASPCTTNNGAAAITSYQIFFRPG